MENLKTSLDEQAIKNMKVADLKKELKLRGLSNVGIKSELTTRLLEAIEKGKDNDEDVLDSDLLGEGFEEDPKDGDSLLLDVLLNESTNENTTKPANSSPQLKDVRKESEDTQKSVTKESKETDETSKVSVSSLSMEDRLALRAQKFGHSKLALRAQRFGLSTPSENTQNQSSISQLPVDAEKLKKRAERFGSVVSSKMKQLEEEAKIKARKDRFGDASSQTISSIGKRTITSSAEDEKKKRRMERFGSFL